MNNDDHLASLAIFVGALFALAGIIAMFSNPGHAGGHTVIILIGAAVMIWGLIRKRPGGSFRGHKKSGTGRTIRCPRCHKEIGGYVTLGSQAEQRVRSGRCPHCGAAMPPGYRIGIK